MSDSEDTPGDPMSAPDDLMSAPDDPMSAPDDLMSAQDDPMSGPDDLMSAPDDPISDSEDPDPLESGNDMSMFASVWVKVEVEGEEENDDGGLLQQINTKYSKRKKRTPQNVEKNLKCEVCDYTTAYKNCLNLHILSHTNYKPYSCTTCDYVTKYPTSLTRHMLIQHQYKNTEEEKNLPLHKCDQCAYTSHYKWNLSAHRRKHKLEKQFQCEKCSYTTAYRHNYMKHSKVHSKNETLYRCDKCPFITKFEGHITRHLAKIHNEVSDRAYHCNLCDFCTHVKWRLNIHKQRSKQNNALKCIYCDFETYFMCESKKHKVCHYKDIYSSTKYQEPTNNEETASNAPECKAVSESAVQTTHEKNNHYILDPVSEVDWHNIQVLESTDKDKPFQCIRCQYTARFKASVQRHYQRHHTSSQTRPYKCLNCDFSTKTKDQIALHNKRSQSDIQMFCRTCNFSTTFKCTYAMHQKCHYEHKCSQCSYTCKNKYEITKHYSIVHLGNGLKCRFCDYKATRPDSLVCHETIHTGNKPFKCEHCEYTSVRKSLLLNHIKRYHSEIKSEKVIIDVSKIEALKVSKEVLEQQSGLAEYLDSQPSNGDQIPNSV